MSTRLVLFDLEETLVDIQIDDSKVTELLRSELQRLNLQANDLQQAKGIEEMLDQIQGRADKLTMKGIEKSVLSKLAETEKASIASSKEKKDSREALASVLGMGVKIGIITRLSEQGANQLVKHLKLEGAFEIFASPYHSADQGEKIVAALKKFALKPEEAMFVVNSVQGIEAAKSTGVQSVGVYSSSTSVRQILSSKPDALVYSISELGQTLLYFAERSRSSAPRPTIEP